MLCGCSYLAHICASGVVVLCGRRALIWLIHVLGMCFWSGVPKVIAIAI